MALPPLVPDLDVVPVGRAPLDLADTDGVEAWRDGNGAVYARCRADGDRCWVDLTGVAAFRFDRRGPRVVAATRRGVDPRAVADAYWHDALPLVLHARGSEVLHASAVVAPAGVIAFCGASGAGKSTLAYGLHRRGYPLWADDVVALEVSPAAVAALPVPFEVRLRPASAALFAVSPRTPRRPDASDTSCRPTDRLAPRHRVRARPLAAVCLLSRASDHPASRGPAAALRRASPSAAYPGVLAHAFCFHLDEPGRKRTMLERYLELIARIPIFELTVADDLERLPEVLDAFDGEFGPGKAR
jgi:hypothetical protein